MSRQQPPQFAFHTLFWRAPVHQTHLQRQHGPRGKNKLCLYPKLTVTGKMEWVVLGLTSRKDQLSKYFVSFVKLLNPECLSLGVKIDVKRQQWSIFFHWDENHELLMRQLKRNLFNAFKKKARCTISGLKTWRWWKLGFIDWLFQVVNYIILMY